MDPTGQPLPPGEPGEICLRGFHVMKGYFENPEATAETIDGDGWLHTGDIGTLDARGYLRITDRLKDMFIVGGFNCYPAEIEAALTTHPAIAQVAVVGVPDERLGEEVKAFVVRQPNAALSEDEFLDWCKGQFAANKYPRQVEFRDQLPISATGKILKRELR